MLSNLIFTGFIVFSLFGFYRGIQLGIQNPLLFLIGIIYLFLFYLLIVRLGNKFTSNVFLQKDSIILKIKKNQTLKILTIGVLWILAIGNFIYANNQPSPTFNHGIEYLEAIILALISFVILNKNIKINL